MTETTKSPERRYCSSCTRETIAEGGKLVRMANGQKRWKCAKCIERSKQATRPAQADKP